GASSTTIAKSWICHCSISLSSSVICSWSLVPVIFSSLNWYSTLSGCTTSSTTFFSPSSTSTAEVVSIVSSVGVKVQMVKVRAKLKKINNAKAMDLICSMYFIPTHLHHQVHKAR